MKDVVKRLLNSDESAYSISKETGDYASVIQRLRLKQLTLEYSKIDNIEKLYNYQIRKEIALYLNESDYEQFSEKMLSIKNTDDYQRKFEMLKELDKEILKIFGNVMSIIVKYKNNKTKIDELFNIFTIEKI